MQTTLTRILTITGRLGESLAAGLLLSIVALNVLAVFFRFVLSDPIGWTEETMRYAIVWATYLGAGSALWRGEHMVLDLIARFEGQMIHRILRALSLLAIAAFCIIILSVGYPLAMANARQVSPVMNISMFWPYLAIPVGCTLITLKALLLLFVQGEADAEAGIPPK